MAESSSLKRIAVADLKVGMFLHKLEGSWINHPFWRSAFVLEDDKDVQAVKTSGMAHVWIDADKGDDVAAPAPAPAASRPVAAPTPSAVAAPAPTPTRAHAPAPKPVSLQEEMRQAQRICSAAKGAIASMLSDARMGKAIDTKGTAPMVEEIAQSVLRNASAIISVARIKTKDEYTYMHSVAVCALMVSLGRQLGLDEQALRDAGTAGLMHDLGKAVMPIDVLNKPSKLTDSEYATIKRHPVEGWRILRESGCTDEALLSVALHHHERMDGKGYPRGLADAQISQLIRMSSVCDVYDAVTSNRPYKAGWDPGTSIRQMNSWKGHFDPAVMQAFIKSLGIYPVGSLLLLESGRLAVVVEQNATSLLKPKIRVFYSTRSLEPIPRMVIDLASPTNREKVVSVEDPKKWGIENPDELWQSLGD